MLFEACGGDALSAFFGGGEEREIIGEVLFQSERQDMQSGWAGGQREDGGVNGDGVCAFFEAHKVLAEGGLREGLPY